MDNKKLSLHEFEIGLNSTIAIFGGGRGWGARIRDAANNLGLSVEVVERDASTDIVLSAVERNSVIFLAVPDSEISQILNLIQSTLELGHKILIDCATNKSGFASQLMQLSDMGVSICSTHPMVRPETCPRGHNVILMPLGEHSEQALYIAKSIFTAMGMIAEQLEFDQHPDMMVILQFIPHFIFRILIDILGRGLKAKNLSIKDLSRLAPANYLLAELGIGRIGVQRPDISGGIVWTAFQSDFGKEIAAEVEKTMKEIVCLCNDRNALVNMFDERITSLDPDGSWRNAMNSKTEAALSRLGNLRSRSFVVRAKNRVALLKDILCILADKYAIDITALDSQIIEEDNGEVIAQFDIGISDVLIDFDQLKIDMAKIGVDVVNSNIK